MMAESLRSKFQEHLSCAICLEKLKDPKVLPCLHSYCHGCIAKLDMLNNVLTCPECRETVEVPAPPDISFLPSNFFAKNLLATLLLASESDSENIVCENCDSGEYPETRCQQCARYLCQFCTESHRRLRDTKTHTLITLDELRNSDVPVITETLRCPKHEDEVIKLYCKTCEDTICRDCTIVDHRQHDYVFARDVTEEKKGELLRLVGEVKQRRSEMSESLEYIKKMEEMVNVSNESTVHKVSEYFEDLKSVAKNRENKFLEEAAAIKCAKLKELHLQQEELELNLGSCDSSIEFTEQAFKNGNDVQILNLTKYMERCLESLKNKKSKVYPPHNGQPESINELPEHAKLCDRMAQFHFLEDGGEKRDMYEVTFRSPSEYLVVEEMSEIIMKPKGISTVHDENRDVFRISPSFEGVGVRDVNIVDNDDGSRTVRFCPIHAGELTFVAYTNGSLVPDCAVTKTVKKRNKIFDSRIGDCVFESGIHEWEIEIDHSDCSMSARVDFRGGVVYCSSSCTSHFKGHVQNNSKATVRFTLDMGKKELQMAHSCTSKVKKLCLARNKRVSPYFWSDCNKCKLTVIADGWWFLTYKDDNRYRLDLNYTNVTVR